VTPERGLRAALLAAVLTLAPIGAPTGAAEPPVAATLADAVYVDEFLQDTSRAAQQYAAVLAHPDATDGERQQATWRLARCQRRLDRPAEARRLLTTLLLETGLPADVRASAERELTLIPRAAPARLMPPDTLVYLEAPQPGVLLERVVAVLRQAGLDHAAAEIVLALLPRVGELELRGFWNAAVQTELAKLDALGVGWRDFQFAPGDAGFEAGSELLLVLYTGGSVATAGVLDGVSSSLFAPQLQFGAVRFFAAEGLRHGPHFAVADGLFVMCTNADDGVAAIQRHHGEALPAPLHAGTRFKRRPPGWPPAAAVSFYVDWQALAERMLAAAPVTEHAAHEASADLLGLRRIGPLWAAVTVREDRLVAELVADTDAAGHPLLRLTQTPPLDPRWLRWIPAEAWFAAATAWSPGAERWRNIEAFLTQSAQVTQLSTPPVSTQPAPPDPLAGLRDFEQRAGLRIAEDLAGPVRGAVLIGLPASGDGRTGLRWALVVAVDQPERWVRQVEQGVGRWLLGDAAGARLPAVATQTPHGSVYLLSVPGTPFGLAWQIDAGRVIIAPGVDGVTAYRAAAARGTLEPPSDLAELSKLVVARVPALLGADPSSALPPMIVRTYERQERTRVVAEQPALAATLRALATELLPEAVADTAPAP